MQELGSIDVNRKIIDEIDTKLEDINEQSSKYIKDIVTLVNNEIGINKILSIILFGSQTPKNSQCNENTPVSDCDLLIIFKDRVSDQHIKEIERFFISLEIKHNFREYTEKFKISKLLNFIQSSTGMFISHFLTKRRYWENAVFHKIFGVNKYVSQLLAPRNIVLSSVIDNSTILYGQDLREIVKERVDIPVFDMIKSTLMNLIIAIFSVIILPFKKLKPYKYNLEAVKWALRASNYYSFADSKSLREIISRFIAFEKSEGYKRRARRFYRRFLSLRENPHTDMGFMLRSMFRVLKIHIKGILFHKMYKNKK